MMNVLVRLLNYDDLSANKNNPGYIYNDHCMEVTYIMIIAWIVQ